MILHNLQFCALVAVLLSITPLDDACTAMPTHKIRILKNMQSTAFPAFANHFYGITSLACMFCEREDSSRYILHHILGEGVLYKLS